MPPQVLIGLERRGRVSLNSIVFLTDPGTYRPLEWEKRHSIHHGIGGSVTIQDFGMYARDNRVILQSNGDQHVLDVVAARTFHDMLRDRGMTYVFEDWIGNNTYVIPRSRSIS